MENMIIQVAGKKQDLNGLPISLRGTTAYKDVYFGWAGYQHDHEVYVAIAGLNEDEQKISGKDTFMFHLSKHDDPRDAAYVAMMFNRNRDENVIKLRGVTTSGWQCDIPKFEYDAIDTDSNKERRMKLKTKIKTPKIKVQNTKSIEHILKTKEQKERADAMTAVWARKDAARKKELAITQTNTYAKYAIRKSGLPEKIQDLIRNTLINNPDRFNDYESGKRFVDGMINNAKMKVAA
jgi:hypothetical protein